MTITKEMTLSDKQRIQKSWMAHNREFSFPLDCVNEDFSLLLKRNATRKIERLSNMHRTWKDSFLNLISLSRANIDESREDIVGISNKWFERLVSFHSEKHRRYHNLCHLEVGVRFFK